MTLAPPPATAPGPATLMRTAAVCLALAGIALLGLTLDHRVIMGAPAWLKPLKFGLSGAVFLATLSLMLRIAPDGRLLRVTSFLIGWILVAEIVVIDVQAARGTTSHFNVDTPLDAALFSFMGTGIGTVWVLTMLVLWLHWRTKAPDRAMALALRVGLALSIAGAGVGWTMTQPRDGQIAAMSRGERPRVIGSHTVGGPDGGPGLPVTRWSRDHGDLRVPHFLGMHGFQLLPLLVLGLRRLRPTRDDGTERIVVLLAGAACTAIFLWALTQALGGHPFLPPSPR